jgi:hypothetical protein
VRSHVCAIENPGGAGVQKFDTLFGPFSAKSHDRATTVMGCMKFHVRTSSIRQVSELAIFSL